MLTKSIMSFAFVVIDTLYYVVLNNSFIAVWAHTLVVANCVYTLK